jgi:regulator of replication initiation timing
MSSERCPACKPLLDAVERELRQTIADLATEREKWVEVTNERNELEAECDRLRGRLTDEVRARRLWQQAAGEMKAELERGK